MLVNGTGAVATGITTCVVLASKFRAGAWVTALLVPTLILLMYSVKKHYTRIQDEMRDMNRLNLANLQEPLVVIPMAGWNRISEKALRFGLLLSKEIKVVHVHSEDESHGIDQEWDDKILAPIREQGMPDPELVYHPFKLSLRHRAPDGLHPAAWNRKTPGGKWRSYCRNWWCGTGGKTCSTINGSSC